MTNSTEEKEWGSKRRNYLWGGKITYEDVLRAYWNLVYFLEELWRLLMERNWGGNRREGFCSKMLENAIWGRNLWKFRGTFHVWRLYGNCWINLDEYLRMYENLNKNVEIHSICIIWSISKEGKKMKCCDIYLNQGPNTYWMDQCQFILCKVQLFLYCDVFLLLRFPFYFISFRFPPSFV